MTEGEYCGPVLFLVHPQTHISGIEQISKQNQVRVIKALIMAGKKGIPVIYAPVYDQEKKNTIFELLKEVPKKPTLIRIPQESIFEWSPAEIRAALKRKRIVPTEITLMGQIRNICVTEAAIAARSAFPKIRIAILEGRSTLFLPAGKSEVSKRVNISLRKWYRERIGKHGIDRTKKFRLSSIKPTTNRSQRRLK